LTLKMSQDHLRLGETSTAFAPCSCGCEEWQVYADEGIRVCTQCSGQLAYIEEGIEDDELDRFESWFEELVIDLSCRTACVSFFTYFLVRLCLGIARQRGG